MRLKNLLELRLEYALYLGEHRLQALHDKREYHTLESERLHDGVDRNIILADEGFAYRLHICDQNWGVYLIHQRKEVRERLKHANLQLVEADHKLDVVSLEIL